MKDFIIRLAAKTDVGLERTNNEDNFQLAQDLSVSNMQWINNQRFNLGKKGSLLVVADGMGGMNAGEVASAIAIDVVRKCFQDSFLTDEVLKNRYSIEKYMKQVIQTADAEIKKKGKQNPENRGMGTTIVMAWIYEGMLYVSWCGDSRAYLYNPANGLHQISKDHSYVQGLVDKGVIKPEDAFDFPDSNIITRSLCDSGPKAIPDCLITPVELCNNDIVLLCSDGLNGMIRDTQIENIISQNQDDMVKCVDSLIEGALHAAGADNVTIALCQVLEGGNAAKANRALSYNSTKIEVCEEHKNSLFKKIPKWCYITIAVLLIIGLAFTGGYMSNNKSETTPIDSLNQKNDTIVQPIIDDVVDENVEENESVRLKQVPNPNKIVNNPKDKNPFKTGNTDSKEFSKTGGKESEPAGEELNITPIGGKASEQIAPTKDSSSEPSNKTMVHRNRYVLYQYRVREGDTWFRLAKLCRVTEDELKSANPGVTELQAGSFIHLIKKQ